MNNPHGPKSSETVGNLKAVGIIVGSATLGALLTYGSGKFFGYEVTLVLLLVVIFPALSYSSSVTEALLPVIVLSGSGYAALSFFPHLLPAGGALCGIAVATAFATFKDEQKRERKENAV